ncbi:hypothetical protein G9A89_016227 [Geosiphon pyriformis]|nr:hypothetical protein G9A89_016227 [Geosiphon pyriformis]
MIISRNIQQISQKLILALKTLPDLSITINGKLEATNTIPKAIQKQIHNEFKTAAGSTNTHYKLRAALRLYDLFNTCENVLQSPILQPLKIQYIGKLTELKFQQFSEQITSIILDYYLDITDSTWTSTKLSLKEEVMLPVEF